MVGEEKYGIDHVVNGTVKVADSCMIMTCSYYPLIYNNSLIRIYINRKI